MTENTTDTETWDKNSCLLGATTEAVSYLDPLQGSSEKEQRARVRLGSLAVPTAAWWTQTKNQIQPQDIKKTGKKHRSALRSAVHAAKGVALAAAPS